VKEVKSKFKITISEFDPKTMEVHFMCMIKTEPILIERARELGKLELEKKLTDKNKRVFFLERI